MLRVMLQLGGIFRDLTGAIMGCFSSYVGNIVAFHVELIMVRM